MISLDTNILVRYLTYDPEPLALKARDVIKNERCFVTRVALLETFYVLDTLYKLDQPALAVALRTILGLTTVTVEAQLACAQAVEWFEAGMDFADALLLASSRGQDGVMTFDRDFSRVAAKLKAEPPITYIKA